MAQFITTLTWHSPSLAVPLACIVLMLSAALVYRFRWQQRVSRLLGKFLGNYWPASKKIKIGLWIIGLSCLALGLMRPAWQGEQTATHRQGRDMLVALDISRSMLATDIKPTRLAHAKEKIKQLIDQVGADRIGLLVFAGSAFVLCPLTSDYQAFLLFLDSIDAQSLSSSSTHISKALEKMFEVFKALSPQQHKLCVLVTDGEDFSDNLPVLRKQAQELNVALFTIGLGTPEGAPVPVLDSYGATVDYQKDAQNSIIISRLNEPLLQKLAYDLGGEYIRATTDSTDIQTLAHKLASFDATHSMVNTSSKLMVDERYYYPVGIGLVCLLIEWILP